MDNTSPKNKTGGQAREREPKTPQILSGTLPGSSHEAKVQLQDHLESVRGVPEEATLNNQQGRVQTSSNSSKATEQLPESSLPRYAEREMRLESPPKGQNEAPDCCEWAGKTLPPASPSREVV